MRVLPLLSLLSLLACASAEAGGPLDARPVPLDPLGSGQTAVGALEYRGGLALSLPGGDFGGLSGMALDGEVLTAVSDAAHWFRFGLRHDDEGRLAGADLLGQGPLLDPDGRPMGKRAGDAEALAGGADGGYLVAFEGRHRIWRYLPDISAWADWVRFPDGLKELPANSGIEAMTRLPDGRLLLIAEGGGEGASPAWLGRPGEWRRLSYPREGEFRPTGAATLPSGDVVVLERRFSFIGGFAARVMLLPAAAFDGRVLRGREMARIEPPLTVDNFEAVAVAPGASGETILYLLADDNFSPFQSTLLLAFSLRQP